MVNPLLTQSLIPVRIIQNLITKRAMVSPSKLFMKRDGVTQVVEQGNHGTTYYTAMW